MVITIMKFVVHIVFIKRYLFSLLEVPLYIVGGLLAIYTGVVGCVV